MAFDFLVNAAMMTNANVYIDGNSLLGCAQEVEIQFPKAKVIQHKSLAMFGTGEYPIGFEIMEARIRWTSLFGQVLEALSVFDSHQFQVRASREDYTPFGRLAEIPVIAILTAQFKDSGSLTFKQQEQVVYPTVLSVSHCECSLAGVQFLLYDVSANMYVVNGVDQLAQFRTQTSTVM